MNEPTRVILYTKAGCHLCEMAKQQMLAAKRHIEFTLDEIDIESDPFLFAKYGLEIPVIMIDGVEAFRHRLTAEDFCRALLSSEDALS